MSNTRFSNDPARIAKKMQEMTDQGRYILNVPGQGEKPCFMEDPHVRLDRWGANLRTNMIDIENQMKGLTKPLSRDCYENPAVSSGEVQYPSCSVGTDETRASNPAWNLRENESTPNAPLIYNPQENLFITFDHNINSKRDAKDDYGSKRDEGVINYDNPTAFMAENNYATIK